MCQKGTEHLFHVKKITMACKERSETQEGGGMRAALGAGNIFKCV